MSDNLNLRADPDRGTTEERWRLLFEQSPLSIQIFSPDGQTIRFNRAWSNLFGLSDEEAYAFNVLKDPVLERTGALAHIRRAFAGEIVFVPPVKFPVRHHPTDMRWIGGTVFPVITPDGVLREVVVVHHDITELKQAEETLRNLNQLLEARVAERTAELQASEEELRKALETERELNLLKISFVGMVSHEFRTPLGVIQSAADLLERHHDKMEAGQLRKHVQSIQRAVHRMAGMMEHILLLGRLDSRQYEPRWSHVDLPAWFNRNLESLCPSPADRSRVCVDVIGGPAILSARIDEILLHHVLGNLLSNACKYSSADTPVRVRMDGGAGELRISVSDQGIGIDAAEQPRLFEGFFRASNVGDRPGSGLGLIITQRCIQRMGGRLELTSKLGVGSTFAVYLPQPGECTT